MQKVLIIKVDTNYLLLPHITFVWCNPTNRGDPIFWCYRIKVVLSALSPVVIEMGPGKPLGNKITH